MIFLSSVRKMSKLFDRALILDSALPLFALQGELVTASKAIIEKEYQPKVIVSKQGPNPFNKLTDQELEEYRKAVEQKQKGTEGKPEALRMCTFCINIPRNGKHMLLAAFSKKWLHLDVDPMQWEHKLTQSHITLICAAWQLAPIDPVLNTDCCCKTM